MVLSWKAIHGLFIRLIVLIRDLIRFFYLKLDHEAAHQRMLGRAREDDNRQQSKNRFNEQMKGWIKFYYQEILTEVDATQGIIEIFR